jgi:hypothetical protein
MKPIVILLALAACGGDSGGGDPGGGGPGPAQSCEVSLFAPTSMPVAPDSRVTVHATPVTASGTLTYAWSVVFDGKPIPTASQTADNSEIAFAAQDPGVYDVSVTVTASAGSCPSSTLEVNVGAANAQSFDYRFRVLPPPGVAMVPIDTVETIPGGATYALGPLFGVGGKLGKLTVVDPDGNGVPAWLQLVPEQTGAEIDAFSDGSGVAMTMAPTSTFDVLVVPSIDGVAPRLFTSFHQLPSTLALDRNTIGGSVVDPTGQPLVGAQVQITADGVPSSVATTGDDGSFTAFSDAMASQSLVIEVVPPAGSGLPRLSATSAEPTLVPSMAIAYAPNLVLRDLAGIVITRGGAPLAGARVTVVGAIGAGGTVRPAHKPVVATGAAVIATAADATGALPSTLVPSAALSAVIALGDGNDDFAVVALDTTASLPATLDAPAPEELQTAITLAGKPVAGAVVDFLPTGALAQAAAPPVEVIADGAGLVNARLAVGGHYDVRVHDPAGAGAVLELSDVESTTLPTAIALAPAIAILGTAVYTPVGATVGQPVAGATVQVLCSDCDGLDAVRPLAEARTDPAGRFVVAIPDPNADSPAVAR